MAKRRRRRLKKKISAGLMIFSLAAAGVLALLLTPMFNVKSVAVYGNSTVSTEAVVSGSGIVEGTNIFGVSLRRVRDNLESMSRISSVKVRRVLPSTIKITVTEGAPIVYIYDDGDCVGITADGLVTDTVKAVALPSDPEPTESEKDEENDEAAAENENEDEDEDESEAEAEAASPSEEKATKNNLGCAVVTGMGDIKYKIGSTIEFSDEIKAENLYKLMKEFLSDEIYEDITSIDMSKYDSATFVYKGTLTVSVGAFENLDYKLQCFKTIISEQLGENARGELNLERLTYKNI